MQVNLNFILFTKWMLHRSLDLIIDYQFLPETTDMSGIAMRGHVQRTISKCRIVQDALVHMFSCNLLRDFLLLPLYVYIYAEGDRVPPSSSSPPGIPFAVYSLILLTGLANDSYLVHREIMKLREKETRALRWTMFCEASTRPAVCRMEAS